MPSQLTQHPGLLTQQVISLMDLLGPKTSSKVNGIINISACSVDQLSPGTGAPLNLAATHTNLAHNMPARHTCNSASNSQH